MRCDPSEHLSETEKSVWRGMVKKVRPRWFYSSEALLRAYVGTIAQLETLARGLAEEEPCSRRYFQILRLQPSVTKTAAMLATSLRLTPRSTVDRYSPKIVRSGSKPWEFDPSEA